MEPKHTGHIHHVLPTGEEICTLRRVNTQPKETCGDPSLENKPVFELDVKQRHQGESFLTHSASVTARTLSSGLLSIIKHPFQTSGGKLTVILNTGGSAEGGEIFRRHISTDAVNGTVQDF